MILTSGYIKNYGNTYLSPWLTGEQMNRTATALHRTFAREGIETPARYDDGTPVTWNEPPVMSPGRSVNTTYIGNRGSASGIVINDDNSSGTILITHSTGTVIQLDSQGTVLIKSTGDTYNHSEGTQFQMSTGDTNLNVGQNYNIMIEGGSNKIWIAGDMEVECENYLVTARGKMTFNSAEGIELKGATISMEAHTDNIDIYSANKIKVGAEGTLSVHSIEALNIQSDATMGIKSAEELVMNGSDVQIKGKTVYIDDVVRMAEGGAGDAPDAENPVVPEMTDPPAPVMTTGSNRTNANPIRPHPFAISGNLSDDQPV